MIKVEVKPNESIDRALKRYKRKRKMVKLVQELRDRQSYTKPSEQRREEIKKAQYREQYLLSQESQ
ncbi:30S ribosomal protein S21 [Robiginitalea sediminis]|uniref:30S ribosomal protein S21 n=1 Tax=Robiginitalea sediminis TaxID=1982593 RepID=UPI000B4BDD71|nr:30S ribosomal protein S21 [Robiginitalea sediminis]